MNYSIQLYGLRDITENNFNQALKSVSVLGYTAVEPAGFFGHTSAEVKHMLSENNLTLSGTHSSFDDLLNNFDETVAFHKIIGNHNYIIPGYDLSSQEKLDFFIEKAEFIKERLANEGINLLYHNHFAEFEANKDGSVPMEQLLYRTSLSLELDTYWAFIGMKDPVALLSRIHERVGFIHIKDGTTDKHGMPLGMGDAPVLSVWKTAKCFGIPMVVESETCSPDGITESKICIEYLRKIEQ